MMTFIIDFNCYINSSRTNLEKCEFSNYQCFDLSNQFHHISQQLVDELIRKNKKENLGNQIVIPKPIFNTTFLDQSDIEKVIYDSALGDTMKMIELCNHILVSEQHSNILGNEPLTLSEIHQKMTDYYVKKIGKLTTTKNNISEILSKNINPQRKEEYDIRLADVNERLATAQSKFNIFNSLHERI